MHWPRPTRTFRGRSATPWSSTWTIIRRPCSRSEHGWTGFGRKDRNWIWTALTARTALFHFATSRGHKALLEVLPEDFPGVLGTDRYAAYHRLQSAARQYCWAHLRRDIIALSESKDTGVEAIAKRMLADQEEIFIWWHMLRDGEIDRK